MRHAALNRRPIHLSQDDSAAAVPLVRPLVLAEVVVNLVVIDHDILKRAAIGIVLVSPGSNPSELIFMRCHAAYLHAVIAALPGIRPQVNPILPKSADIHVL